MYAVIPAAGSGTRMGALTNGCPKVLLELGHGIPILEQTVRALVACGELRGIVIATRAEDMAEVGEILERSAPGLDACVVRGGESRQSSVHLALGVLQGKCEFVLVHDAARPFCSTELLRKAASTCRKSGACVVAVRAKATLKRVKAGRVLETVPRAEIWEAQTPQAFSYDLLRKAYDDAAAQGIEATDDSQLVELSGTEVEIVEGSDANIKITTPHDLEFAREAFLKGL